jgi:hypothetical protein
MFKIKIIIKYAYELELIFTAIFILDANTLLHHFFQAVHAPTYLFVKV